MKVLAAVSIRQYEEAADSIREYFNTVELGLQIIFQKQDIQFDLPISQAGLHQKTLMIIFGSGQPMCGQFNEVIASYVHERLESELEHAPARIVAVGTRVAANLEGKGLQVDEYFEVPGSVSAINEQVEQLVLMLERWFLGEGYKAVILFNNRPVSQSSFIPVRHQVLPIDKSWLDTIRERPWSTNNLPIYTMNTEQLLSTLVRQYIFVSIYKSFAESLSAEQGSRLESMHVAERKIEEHLTKLHRTYHQKRQSDITEEITDIMAGFEVLNEEEN